MIQNLIKNLIKPLIFQTTIKDSRGVYIIKKYYDKKIYMDVNKPNKEALNEYLNYVKLSKGLNESTINQYEFDIKDFLCWIHQQLKDKYILNIQKYDLIQFFEYTSQTMNVSRTNRLISSIKMFMDYFVKSDKYSINKNPADYLKHLKKKRIKEDYYITDEEIKYLIDYFINKQFFQKALWVSIMYDTAMKKSTCLRIKKIDVLNMSNNIISINNSKNQRCEYLLSNRTQNIASLYLKYRGKDDIPTLFVSGSLNKKHRSSAKNSTLHEWSKSCCKILNTKEDLGYDFNTKDFRNSSLKNFYDGTHYILKEKGIKRLSLDEVHYLSHNKNIDSTMKSINFYENINIYNIFHIDKQYN